MAPYDSDDDDRRRDRFPRERGYGADRNGGAVNNENVERRAPFKRSYPGPPRRDDDNAKRPRNDNDAGELLSLKAYAAEQNIALDAEELGEKYATYKDEYNKRICKQFFEAHKEEEWFKKRYHPTQLAASEAQRREAIVKRIEAYNKLSEMGYLSELSLDPTNARNVVRLLNAAAVLVNGGDDEKLERVMKMEITDAAVQDVLNDGLELPAESDKESEPSLLEWYAGIFIRCIPPSMTDNELHEVCQRYPGYNQLHFFPVQPETRWSRKAIAAFRTNVDLKDLCIGINGVRVKGSDLVAYLAPNTGERVRVSHPFINHKPIALAFLHKATKILALLDKKSGQFLGDAEEEQPEEIRKNIAIGFDYVSASTNPLIVKAREVLPKSLDDDEALRRADKIPDAADVVFERDERVIKVLDEITFYLRVVYSFDLFDYNRIDDEETLPNNLEMLHIRGQDIKPSSDDALPIFKKGALRIFEQEVQKQLEPFYTARFVSDAQLAALGTMDPESAVEELIKKNTVQLSEEKWLCPLSGKKFKGPEFIRKHITSKHMDAVDAVKAESLFFNNYLLDADRPCDTGSDAQESRVNDPRERRRMAPVRREERSPRKEPMRRFIAYKDLDAVEDSVPNPF
ncbi:unnamed protein product, partial [Mesorhabditis spiculigera]